MRTPRPLAAFAALLCALVACDPAAAQTVVLHDNGGIVTAAGAAVDGAGLSAVQTGEGLALTGHGAAIALGQRVADDFSVPAGGWRIARFEFATFQPGSSRFAAPFDRVHLRVWDGVPGAAESQVVFGDLGEDRLAEASFAGAYRVTGLGSDLERPVFDVAASVGTLVLAQGTYWVEWQVGASREGGPYAVPVSAANDAPGGNARQFAGDWRAVRDGAATQDLSFRIIGRDGDGGAQPPTIFQDGFED